MIAAIYLGAGKSCRMGASKLSLTLPDRFSTVPGGLRLGSLALEQLKRTGIRPIIAVTQAGAPPAWLAEEAHWQPGGSGRPDLEGEERAGSVIRVPCEDAPRGMAYSIRCGMREALRFHPEAVVIVLADQPWVSSEMILRLTGVYRQGTERPSFVASGDRGKAKPPILFGRDMFDALLKLEGDQGARQLLASPAYQGRIVEEADPARFFDADTPDDWQELLQQAERWLG